MIRILPLSILLQMATPSLCQTCIIAMRLDDGLVIGLDSRRTTILTVARPKNKTV